MIPKKEELELTIDESEWSWLRPHLERDALILVDESLDLADAALKLAADDSECIETWIRDRKIGKPSDSQVLQWNEDKIKRFAMLIVSPFVLIQERPLTFH
jgi:hypothetical protein